MVHATRCLLLVLLGCLLILSACGGPYKFRGATLEPAKDAPDFTLMDYNGQPFRLSEQRGNIVLLFFGFTSCPEVCPTTFSDIQQAFEQLGRDSERIKTVLITVDPERDTLDRLKRYVTAFNPQFLGVRGEQPQLDAVLKAYGATATRRELPSSSLKYMLDHSAYIYVIDQQGKLRVLFPYGGEVSDIVSDLRYLAQNGGA